MNMTFTFMVLLLPIYIFVPILLVLLFRKGDLN